MRITAFSDTHGFHDKLHLPGGDLLIFAGDWSRDNSREQFDDFAYWLSKQDYTRKLVMPGNHDGLAVQEKDMVVDKFAWANAEYVEDELVEIAGLRIYCSPWSPIYGVHSFMCRRGCEMKRIWDKIPEDLDILVTHTPPFGYGDKIFDRAIINSSETATQKHVGCGELARRVGVVRPRIHIFGHVHSEAGQFPGTGTHEGTLFLNVSICDGSYRATNKPFTFGM